MNRLVGFWLLSLVVVGLLASVVTAQVARSTPPRIVSGSDVGFRIEGRDTKGQPTGKLMVRIDGEWMAVSNSVERAPAITSR